MASPFPQETIRNHQGSRARIAAGLLVFVMVLATYLSFGNALSYDEAIYLNIAKSLVSTGIPYRSSIVEGKSVFATSPPLVMYVASLSQRFWPSDEFPSRVIHLIVFGLPCCLLVWYIARKEFGDVAACCSLAALLGMHWFLREMGHVQLDGPLALLSLLTLWAFSQASGPARAKAGWSIVAAVSLFLAMWTKYQAICIVAGILLYWTLLLLQRQYHRLRRTRWPMMGIAAAGVLGLATLYAYYCVGAGLDARQLCGVIRGNLDRTSHPNDSGMATCLGVLNTVRAGVWYLGGCLPVAASLALVRGRARWRFSELLLCFCAATVLFNLWAFRLPGGGQYYLLEMVPALAVLVGRPVAVALSWQDSRRTKALIAAVAVLMAVHLLGGLPRTIAATLDHANGPKAVSEYIKQNSREGAWLLSHNVALEFYTERPTGVLHNTSEDLVLDVLAGEGDVLVTHVGLPNCSPRPFNRRIAQKVWSAYWLLLQEHFRPVPLGVEGFTVLERKHPWPSEVLAHRTPENDPSATKTETARTRGRASQ